MKAVFEMNARNARRRFDAFRRAAYYAYDAASNLVRTLGNDAIATYFGYDALNRRTAILYLSAGYGTQPYGTSPYGGNAPQYFAYDANSNLVAASDAWSGSYFGYDRLSRLAARNTPRGDAVYYAYDADSNLTKLQYPRDGQAAYFGYDQALRLEKQQTASGGSAYYEYDASGNVVKKTLGNGMESWAAFDKAERMAALKYNSAGGAAVAYFIYGRGASGRIERVRREGDLAVYYGYDNTDRLLAETWRTASDGVQIYAFTYQYDDAGNRLAYRKESTAGAEYESAYYEYAADNSMTRRRKQVPPSTFIDTYFTYDANGSLLREIEGASATYFEYGANQLISKITPPTGSAWNFYYDGRLNRYRIDRGGTVRDLLWDGLNCLEERNSDGALYARYTYGYSRIYGIGSCVEAYLPDTNKTYTLAMDQRGTVHVLLDESGAEAGRRYYDAFGVILGQTGIWPVDLGYQTNWQTVQIGNKWWGLSSSRVLDYSTGRFGTRDIYPGPNKYTAFSNDPVNKIDRLGWDDEGECCPDESRPDTWEERARETFRRWKAQEFLQSLRNSDPFGRLGTQYLTVTLTSTGYIIQDNFYVAHPLLNFFRDSGPPGFLGTALYGVVDRLSGGAVSNIDLNYALVDAGLKGPITAYDENKVSAALIAFSLLTTFLPGGGSGGGAASRVIPTEACVRMPFNDLALMRIAQARLRELVAEMRPIERQRFITLAVGVDRDVTGFPAVTIARSSKAARDLPPSVANKVFNFEKVVEVPRVGHAETKLLPYHPEYIATSRPSCGKCAEEAYKQGVILLNDLKGPFATVIRNSLEEAGVSLPMAKAPKLIVPLGATKP